MTASGSTHTGLIRKENQDVFLIDNLFDGGLYICLVCDGMGGANSGNVASALAANTFVDSFRAMLAPDLQNIEQCVVEAVSRANTQVYVHARTTPDFSGMGTTLVAAVITKNSAIIANIGDSRAYLIESDQITQISNDHSLVQEMVNIGKITPREAKNHPDKNLITRAVGTDENVQCDIYHVKCPVNSCIFLCSDGLYDLVDDDEILHHIKSAPNLQQGCDTLIDLAISRGGHDNITAVLFYNEEVNGVG